jgi:hypothetical protein
MGYELYVEPEVETWLSGLRAESPEDASQVDEALAALRTDGPAAGPPLVVPAEFMPGGDAMTAELDYCYQYLLQILTRVRREASEAATLRATLERHLEQPLSDDQRIALRAARDRIAEQETKITDASRRIQQKADAFRIRKEVLKASVTEAIADAIGLIVDANLVSGEEESEPPGLFEVRPGAPDRIVARLLVAAEHPAAPDEAQPRVFAAATSDEVLNAWYSEVIPAAYPELALRISPVSAADPAAPSDVHEVN